MDRGAWLAAVLRVTQSWTQLKRLSMHTHMHATFSSLEITVLNCAKGRHICTHIAECRLMFEKSMDGPSSRTNPQAVLSVVEPQNI